MTSLMIKDLACTKELSAEDRAAVRGGSNFGSVGGQTVLSGGNGSVVAVNMPTLTQTDYHPKTTYDSNVANIDYSKNIGVFQI
jgi:hypothetical protein